MLSAKETKLLSYASDISEAHETYLPAPVTSTLSPSTAMSKIVTNTPLPSR